MATAQDSQVKRRLTPKEIEALPGESAGADTSGLPAVTTRVLFGDPTKSGLYTIELKVAPNTIIRAHSHRDTRTAVVISGLWHFGYGPRNEQALVKPLPPGAFYTEPAGESHFARTGPEGNFQSRYHSAIIPTVVFGMAPAVHAPAARIAAWGRFRNEGAPARNHGAITLSNIKQPKAELGINGQIGLPHR